jgi:23S rRNA (uridine2552-2'-O)-methyltransferase
MSDMAPNMSGTPEVDQPGPCTWSNWHWTCAVRCWRTNGSFVVKVFQGAGFDEYLQGNSPVFQCGQGA